MAFSILSLNVYGLRDADQRSGLVQWLRSLPSSTDFVCLQETHCISEQEACSWFSSTGYCVASSCGSLRFVVVLFFTGLFIIYLIRILFWRAGFPFVLFRLEIFLLISPVCTHLTGILPVMTSLMDLLTLST